MWLTQQLIADLFQTTVPNISMHIRNVFEEGELSPKATVKKFLTVRQEGDRQVQRELEYYNLDMIISVGYRVKSAIATRFRQWATQREFELLEVAARLGEFTNSQLSAETAMQKQNVNGTLKKFLNLSLVRMREDEDGGEAYTVVDEMPLLGGGQRVISGNQDSDYA